MTLRTTLLATLLAGLPVAASDVGFGVSYREWDGSGTVFLPIRNGDWLVEPCVAYSRVADTTTWRGQPPTSTDYQETTWRFGVGLFRVHPISDALRGHVGLRVGQQTDSAQADPSAHREGRGSWIAPTLGVEWFANRRFSVGASVGVEHRRMTWDTDFGPGIPGYSTRTTSTGTTSELILRWYF